MYVLYINFIKCETRVMDNSEIVLKLKISLLEKLN